MAVLPSMENDSMLFWRGHCSGEGFAVISTQSPTMKPLKTGLLLTIGFALLTCGCSSLRPPAADKAVWLQEQEDERKNVTAQEKDMENLLYYLAEGLGSAFVH
jgi:hypothetical protein